MVVKNNYNECLTNLACSIRKYFDLDYKHNSLEIIDKELDEYQPKNVVLFLFDGMGSNIIDRVLDSDSFFIKNRIKPITTVFPATTVAATTSIMTGLNPIETGMLGWDMYYKDIDKTITVFKNCEKEDIEGKELIEAKEYNKKHMIRKTIMEEINEKGKYKAYHLSPFKEQYTSVEDLMNKVENICRKDGKKFLYCYDMEPDTSMHALGLESQTVEKLIRERNYQVELLSRKLKDTIIIVIADHGHLTSENMFLEDYKDIEECLLRNTSLEPRAVNFFIKENKKEVFKERFIKHFGEYFDLYTTKEVLDSKLFGDGEENEIIKDTLGDFIAISHSKKTLLYHGNTPLKSTHAGNTDDEILIPLILKKTKKN